MPESNLSLSDRAARCPSSFHTEGHEVNQNKVPWSSISIEQSANYFDTTGRSDQDRSSVQRPGTWLDHRTTFFQAL